ncbi:DNA replication protein DnaD [Mycoplasmopsis caviae]|uniref:DNA replication protein DnaD n=1 Tax=Mycoplasmopsis caviae TaxID=55603 RepID=A0A3P8K927_9BACT|nr:DNA replication protein DnaD [Mycoplasmopsis caviae]UUD35332.1 DNA replication protein DnaD [Mycoplasmopsis caviae]VDR41889.1 DnaD domain-containing protein [Mycoplasmopsis caviae]
MLRNIPYAFFRIKHSSSVSGEDLKNLRKFYAPILGSDAILLYEYLRDLSFSQSDETGFYDYDSLTYLLNMDVDTLNSARIKLESVSLISTFLDEFNRKTLFIIEKPLDSTGFKKNLILANKLISIIGSKNFERLVGRERNIYLSKASHLLDASASFDEVFPESEEDLTITFSHEVDSSMIKTQEIVEEIKDKLSFNTFDYPNPYEAILKTDSRYFYSQISHKIPTQSVLNLIKESREKGFGDPCLNLVFFYAYNSKEVSSININYVTKIVNDLIKKTIFSFEAIERYLDEMLKIKNKVAVSKINLYKATYLESLQREDNQNN